MANLAEVQSAVMLEIRRDLADKDPNVLLTICVSGLAEEAGEVAGLLKRKLRNQNIRSDATRCAPIEWISELGDVLWYLAAVASAHGVTLNEIWEYNRYKLERRYSTDEAE